MSFHPFVGLQGVLPGSIASNARRGKQNPPSWKLAYLLTRACARPAVRRPTLAESAAAAAETYVVQPGDSVWRIANRFGVPQEDLMEANAIDDPRKMRAGMTLRIPPTE